jgi:metal-sulfur cluster biosynthetic enzyme/Fe-S cluster assembly iron-binding protein IscA
MSIELTASAAQEIRHLLRQQELDENDHCLRVGVKGFGPTRQFTLSLEEPDAQREVLILSQGIRVSFNPEDQAKLQGVKIDFREVSGMRGFTFELPSNDISRQQHELPSDQPPPDESQVREALREVIDPEVGINIVDLGLVYGVRFIGRTVHVIMTMTTPACPLGEHIRNEVQTRVFEQCGGVQQVEVEIVWDPPWSSDKISPEGKKALGWSR